MMWPVSTSSASNPADCRNRRWTSSAPSSARRVRYSSGDGSGDSSSTGAHQRRMAKPTGESKWLVPSGAGSNPSVINPSKDRRSRSPGTTPWQ